MVVEISNMLVRRGDLDNNNYIYIPSLAAAIVAFLIFGILSIILAVQIRRWRTKYMVVLAVGAGCESLGYFFRALSASGNRLTSFPLFLLMDLFVILSPLTFMAGMYLVYGRLVRRLVLSSDSTSWTKSSKKPEAEVCLVTTPAPAPGSMVCGKRVSFSPLAPEHYARLFVMCDITSFMIQSAGSSLIVSSNMSTAQLGKNILMAGLAFGLATFIIFILLVCFMLVNVSWASKQGFLSTIGLGRDWWKILIPILVGSLCILVRTVYRLIEFAGGYNGHIYTTEWYIYVFDTVFMVVCAAIWIPFFPAKYGLDQSLTGLDEMEQIDTPAAQKRGWRKAFSKRADAGDVEQTAL